MLTQITNNLERNIINNSLSAVSLIYIRMRATATEVVSISIFVLIAATLAYTALGGVVFHYLERDQEVRDRERSRDRVEAFLGK